MYTVKLRGLTPPENLPNMFCKINYGIAIKRGKISQSHTFPSPPSLPNVKMNQVFGQLRFRECRVTQCALEGLPMVGQLVAEAAPARGLHVLLHVRGIRKGRLAREAEGCGHQPRADNLLVAGPVQEPAQNCLDLLEDDILHRPI